MNLPKPAVSIMLRFCAIIILVFSTLFSQHSFGQCVTIPTLSCSVAVSATPTGAGVWNVTTCGFSTPGSERVYSFTPTVTGIYSIQVNSVAGGYIDYFYKAASGGCNATGWTCIDDINFTGNFPIGTLTAGVQYYILLDPEGTGSYTHNFQVNCPAPDPCISITTLACTTPVSLTLAGSGAWNNSSCGFSIPGQEKLYSFTPTTTGVHSLQVTAASGTGYIDYMYKAASGGCSATGWTCIDDINFTTTATIGTLTAGVQYYILADAESTTSSTQTFQINCPSVVDPCTSITTLACATPVTLTLTGSGAWNNSTCGFSIPGQEKVYSFTPTTTGAHSLQVTAASGTGYIDYMYKAASGGCSSTGWTCIDDVNFTGTFPIGTLTAGVQYYILGDAESTASSTQTFRINCPVACPTNNWTGTTSTNWFTTTNWSCGTVPTATTDVSIPSGTPNSPVISGGTAQVHNLTIQASATLTNNGTLNINGGGVVTNSGTYKGTGTFTGALYNNNGGIVAPGLSPGCTVFGGGYTNGTGTEQIEIAGTIPCTQHDQLQVTGTATLSGILDVILFGGYIPSCGESYKIMTSTTLVGTFTTINYPALPAGLTWGIQYNLPNPGDVTLNILGTPAAVATPASQTTCSGTAITTIVLNGSPIAATTYNWTRDNTVTVTGIAASGSGNISGTLTNTTTSPVTVTFTITPTSGLCTGAAITATVTVNPIPTVDPVANQAVCNGAPTAAINFTGAVPGTVYNWTNNTTSIGLAGSGSGNIPSFTATNATASPVTATITVTPSYTNAGTTCTGSPITFTITVNPTPVFSVTGGGYYCGGTTVTLTATAGFASYAWFRFTSAGYVALGVTTSTLTVTQSGNYRVDVSNGSCTSSIFTAVEIGDYVFTGGLSAGDASLANRLLVLMPTSLCAAPKACPGNSGAAGPFVYDLYSVTNITANPVCAVIGLTANCSQFTTASAYLGSFDPLNNCTNYLGDLGSAITGGPMALEVTIPGSATIVIKINNFNSGIYCNNYRVVVDIPRVTPAITATPATTVCAGTPVTLTASAANSYLWSPGGATTQSINVSPSTTTTYTVTLGYGNNGCTTPVSQTITVNPNPVVSIIPPGPTTICAGSNLTLTASATCNNAAFSGLMTGTQEVPPNASTARGLFYGTFNSTTNQLTFTVIFNGLTGGAASAAHIHSGVVGVSGPIIVPLPGFPAATSGTYTNTFTLSAANAALLLAGNTYVNIHNATFPGGELRGQITNMVTNGYTISGPMNGGMEVPPNASTATGNFAGTYNDVTNQLMVHLIFNNLIGGNAIAAHIHAAAPGTNGPVIINFPGFPAATSGNYSITAPVPAANLAGFMAGNTYINIHNAVFPGGEIRGQIATPTAICASNTYLWSPGGATTQSITVSAANTYTVTVTDGNNCSGSANTVVNVNPVPTVDPVANQVVCNGSPTAAINFTGAVPGTVYNWTNNTTSIGLAASGTGNIASFTAINTGTTPVVATITVTPSYTNGGTTCTGSPITFTITVNPTPDVNQPANQVVCNGAPTAPVNFTGSVPGTIFNWTNSDPSIGLAASGTGNIASFTAINTGTTPVVATVTVTPSTGGGASGLIPEVLYYKFDGSGTSVPNLASAPPPGTATATLMGGLTQGGSAICNGTVIGSGAASSTDYVNTGWAPNLGTSSWTISFKSENIAPSATLFYCFGDINTNSFRCFTNGVAGPNNWILRGAGLTDITINGGATVAPHTNTFVYDNTLNQVRAYLDGVLVSTVAQGAVNLTGSGPFKVNGYSSNVGSPLNGHYDEFRLFNRALTPAEILSLNGCPALGSTCTGSPRTFTYTVNPTPTVDPVANQVVCNGSLTAAINFTGAVPGTVYNWTNNTTSIGLAASGTGNIASFTATNATTAAVIATITVTPSYTNGGTTCTGTPITFTITVNPTPDVNQPANQVVCNGDPTAPVNFTGSVPGTVFSWTNNTTSIGLAASGTGNIASFTATNATNAPVVATITVTPSTPGGSSGSATFNYTGSMQTWTVPAGVTSVNLNAVGAQGGSVTTTCAATGGLGARMQGDFAVTPGEVLNIMVGQQGLTNGADAGGGGGTFVVRGASTALLVAGGGGGASNDISNCGGGGNRNGVNATITTSGTASGNGLVSGGTGGNGGGASNGSGGGGGGFLTDGVAGTGLPGNNGKSYLNGGAGGTGNNNDFGGFGGGGAGWFTGGNGGGGGGYSGGGTSGSQPFSGGGGGGSFNAGTNQVNTAGAGTGNGQLVITYAGAGPTCTGTVRTFTITVNPTATVNAVPNQVVCNGAATAAVNFSSPTTGGTIVYNWTNNTTSIGLAASGTGNIASFTATNITNAPVVATITVTPTYTNGGTSCVGTPITFTITVNPTATVDPVPNQQVCNAFPTAPVNFTSPTTGGTIVYNWTNNTPSIGLAASGSGNIASFIANNPGTVPVVATITVTPTYTNGTSCVGTPITFTITVNPTPNATIVYLGSPYCSNAGTANVTRTGTAGGTYSAAPAGLTLNAATGAVTLGTSTPGTYTVTYTIAASGGCPVFTTTASITITAAPAATISYAGSPYCSTDLTAPVTRTGTAGGTYSAAPAGLTINATTGTVTPNTSTPGTYTVTYSIPAGGGCGPFSTTTTITITQAPNAIIFYLNNPYCSNAGTATVSRFGTAGGTYSAAPAGLVINATTGAVTLGTSTPGTYTVTYTIPAGGGCGITITTTTITITAAPSATIAYTGSPYCSNAGTANVTRTGTAGGTYSSTPGLTLNATTGAVTLATSTPGTYVVTYTIAASGGCATFTTTTSITITALPAATISYAGSPYCSNGGTATVTRTGTAGGTYSAAPAGLVINAATGDVNLGTSTAGTYTVTYTIAAGGGCPVVTTTTTITITTLPAATITYAGNPYCQNAGTATVTRTGTAGGTYSAAPAGLTINASTGAVTLATSTPGTYTVTYTLAAGGGCPAVTATTSITVSSLSVAATAATASSTSLCGPTAITLSVTGGSLGSGATWRWYSGTCGGTLVGSGATLNITPTATTTYFVRAEGTCNTTTCVSVTVTVNVQPTIALTATLPTSLMPGQTSTLTATVTPADPTNTTTWYRNGNVVPGATGSSLVVGVDALGLYTVRTTTTAGCTALSNAVLIKDSASAPGVVWIYPNPNSGQFMVRYYSNAQNLGFVRHVIMYNQRGQKVWDETYPITGPYSNMNVDARKLPSGTYVVQVTDAFRNEILATGRVVIVR